MSNAKKSQKLDPNDLKNYNKKDVDAVFGKKGGKK
jgi:hypothetical protein